MIGLVLVTHGRLAEELRNVMEHVVGPQAGVATVCIFPEDRLEDMRNVIRDGIQSVDQGDGVVLLTDILGGTPSNLASQLADHKTVEVIAGVNMPMLVKLAKVRGTEPLAEAVAIATAAGRKYIACPGELPDSGRPNGTGANGSAPNGSAPGGTPPGGEGKP
jgi:PTS system mannose-specific IIA component